MSSAPPPPLAPCHLAGLAGGFAGARRIDHLGHDLPGVLGPLFQVGTKVAGQVLLDRRLDFAGDQLVLRLGRELGIRNLDGDHGRQAFTGIVAGRRHLRLLGQVLSFNVAVQRPGERRAEPGEVRAAVRLGNVVRIGEDLLLETIVPLHRDLDRDAVVARMLEVEHLVESGLVAVQVVDKRPQAAFVQEALLLARTFVAQVDGHTRVQECEFAELPGQQVVLEVDVREGLPRRLEDALGAPRLGFPDDRERPIGFAVLIGLLIDLAVPPHDQPKRFRQGIDHRGADTVKTPGYLVGTRVELAAGVERRQDHFCSGDAFLVVDVHGHAATVVPNGDRLSRMDDHVDFIAVAPRAPRRWRCPPIPAPYGAARYRHRCRLCTFPDAYEQRQDHATP